MTSALLPRGGHDLVGGANRLTDQLTGRQVSTQQGDLVLGYYHSSSDYPASSGVTISILLHGGVFDEGHVSDAVSHTPEHTELRVSS